MAQAKDKKEVAAVTKKQSAADEKWLAKFALLEKRMGGSLVSGDGFVPKEWLKFGVEAIDSVLSRGKGFPRGIVMEVCGKSQAGKTKICYDAIAWCNANGLPAVFVNAENGFFDERAKEQGIQVNNKRLFAMLDDCTSAEEYAEGIKELVESELFALIVVDSISSLVPQAELDKGYGENSTLGIHARFVKKLTSELNQLCKKHNTTVIFINQFRAAAGKMPGKMVDKPTGGVALEHYSRIRVWLERVSGDAGRIPDLTDPNKKRLLGGYSHFHIMKGNYGGQDERGVMEIMFVAADRNPIGEFMFKLKNAAKYEPLKDLYREKKATKTKPSSIQYVDEETGEVAAEAEAPIEFIRKLLNTPSPAKFSKAGKGDSAFDFLCANIKMYEAQKRTLIEALDKPEGHVGPAMDVSDDDILTGGLNLDDASEEELEGEE